MVHQSYSKGHWKHHRTRELEGTSNIKSILRWCSKTMAAASLIIDHPVVMSWDGWRAVMSLGEMWLPSQLVPWVKTHIYHLFLFIKTCISQFSQCAQRISLSLDQNLKQQWAAMVFDWLCCCTRTASTSLSRLPVPLGYWQQPLCWEARWAMQFHPTLLH